MRLEIQYKPYVIYNNYADTQLFVQELTSQVHKIHHVQFKLFWGTPGSIITILKIIFHDFLLQN